MPHDLGTWGFYISIAALMLMYPVGLLINLTSPFFQRLLARRSKAATVRRLEELIAIHAAIRDEPMIGEDLDHILNGIIHVIGFTLAIGSSILGLLLIYSVILTKEMKHPIAMQIYILVYVAFCLSGMYVLGGRIFGYLVRYQVRVSPQSRANLEEEITELTRKIRVN